MNFFFSFEATAFKEPVSSVGWGSRQLSCVFFVLQHDDTVRKQQVGLASQPARLSFDQWARNLRKSPKARLLFMQIYLLSTDPSQGGGGRFMQHLIDLLPAWLYSNIY